MFTGFNSNVEWDGKVYHVQTEDKGLDDPIVETRVYSGGQVVASVQLSYADLAESPDYAQDKIQRRMKEQHQGLIRNLELGHLEDLEVRMQAAVEDPDADNLLEEYVEDWIDTSAWTTTVLKTLEHDVDVGASAAKRSSRKQKKKSSWRGSRSA